MLSSWLSHYIPWWVAKDDSFHLFGLTLRLISHVHLLLFDLSLALQSSQHLRRTINRSIYTWQHACVITLERLGRSNGIRLRNKSGVSNLFFSFWILHGRVILRGVNFYFVRVWQLNGVLANSTAPCCHLLCFSSRFGSTCCFYLRQ